MNLVYSIVRTPEPDLLRQAIRLHRAALDQTFLASLGDSFLAAIYDALLRSGIAFLVVARAGDRLVGFILGSTDSSRMMTALLRSPRSVAALLAALIRRPSNVARAFETLTYERKTAGTIHAELIVIAVEPDQRSMGVGRRLIAEFEGVFRAAGVSAYRVTVHARLIDANRFYARNGFHLASTFRLYGLDWNLYVRDVDDDVRRPAVAGADPP